MLAENIKEARAEYARGEVKRGTVDELMKVDLKLGEVGTVKIFID